MSLFSCDSDNKSTSTIPSSKLILSDSIRFKTGMITNGNYAGTLSSSKNQHDELFYFCNKNTSKKISFFNDKSELIDEVQLDSVLSRCFRIDGLDIISLDSIVILSSYSNNLFFIDRQGSVFKQISLDGLILKNLNDRFTFRSSRSDGRFVLNDSTIVLTATWEENTKIDFSKLSHNELMKEVIKSSWKTPNLVIIHNIFSEKPTIDFNFNIHRQVFNQFDSLAFLNFTNWYNFTNNNIIIWSFFSDEVILMDSKTNILKKESIKSSKYKIGAKYFRINQQGPEKLQAMVNNLGKSSTFISNVLYDTQRKIYYIRILHKIPLDWFETNYYRPWSLLVYDENFNKLEEIPFEDKKYSGMMKLSNLGLMIETKKEMTDYKNQEATFEIYNYEK